MDQTYFGTTSPFKMSCVSNMAKFLSFFMIIILKYKYILIFEITTVVPQFSGSIVSLLTAKRLVSK